MIPESFIGYFLVRKSKRYVVDKLNSMSRQGVSEGERENSRVTVVLN
jgi:hypothetical protein